MKTYIFKVVLEKDFFDDGREAYHAYVQALKGAATWGYTKEEAIENIKEVIQMVVESKNFPTKNAKAHNRSASWMD